MKAQVFYREWKRKLSPPTDRKIVNLARKLRLRDTLSEVMYWTGLPEKKAQEFVLSRQ